MLVIIFFCFIKRKPGGHLIFYNSINDEVNELYIKQLKDIKNRYINHYCNSLKFNTLQYLSYIFFSRYFYKSYYFFRGSKLLFHFF